MEGFYVVCVGGSSSMSGWTKHLELIWKGDIIMAGKPTYNELERKNQQLEKEVLEYIRKAKELNKNGK